MSDLSNQIVALTQQLPPSLRPTDAYDENAWNLAINVRNSDYMHALLIATDIAFNAYNEGLPDSDRDALLSECAKTLRYGCTVEIILLACVAKFSYRLKSGKRDDKHNELLQIRYVVGLTALERPNWEWQKQEPPNTKVYKQISFKDLTQAAARPDATEIVLQIERLVRADKHADSLFAQNVTPLIYHLLQGQGMGESEVDALVDLLFSEVKNENS
jgi:hypothetical protein